jgi:hypothetical protein
MSISQSRSEFDKFLYAQIEEGSNGMLLSVLSALARLDIDPWQEAGNLTRMTREGATQRLASLISALPGGPLAHLDARTIAARLVRLLPHRPSVNIASHEMLPETGALNNSRALMYIIIANVIFLVFSLGSQYFTHQPMPHTSFRHALAAKAGAPQVPMPSFGK